MTSRRFPTFGALTLAGCLLCLGCGPSQTTADPDKVQSAADYKEEMEKNEAVLMGGKVPPPAKTPDKDAESKPVQ